MVLSLAGCTPDDDTDQPERPSQDVMLGAPLYVGATAIGSRGSAETLEYLFRTPTPPDSLAAWYRERVLALGWDIAGDAALPNGGTSLYVTREGTPLWIIINPAEYGTGSEFSLIGAAPDTSTSPMP